MYDKILYDGGQHRLRFIILKHKFQKGGRSMNCTVVVDWKFAVALGATTVGIIFAIKMDAADAKEVSIHAIDAYKEYTVAVAGNC